MLPIDVLLKLKRWNTPTIYNGWEQITRRDHSKEGINLEETRDFMPHMGPMVGYAVTLVVEPSNPKHRETNPNAWSEYRRYVAGVPGPKIVVVQDLDKPRVIGSFCRWAGSFGTRESSTSWTPSRRCRVNTPISPWC